MPLKRLTAFVLPVGKTGLPRLTLVRLAFETGFCFRQPERIIEALSNIKTVKLTISVSDFIADGIVYCEPCKARRGNPLD